MVSRLWEDLNLAHNKGQARGVIISFEDLVERSSNIARIHISCHFDRSEADKKKSSIVRNP